LLKINQEKTNLQMLIFTDRELQKAWRENKKASEVTPRQNPHRLLLFYAVE
jgi:hypothetical protein